MITHRTIRPHGPAGFRLRRKTISALAALGILIASGCATVGQDFSSTRVSQIQLGKTTKAEVREMFGEPWRVGIEDGLETWSYGKYRYSMFSEKDAKDLVIRFTPNDIVKSYTFNTTNK